MSEIGESMSAFPALRLLLVRHGKAERRSDSGKDGDRALTGRGERQAAWLAEKLRVGSCMPALVLHSPVLRAAETARIMQAELKCPMQTAAALAVDEPLKAVLHLISSYRGMGTLAVVGHNPQLESVAGALVPDLDEHDVNLRTGECLVLEIGAGLELLKARLVERLRMDEED